MRTVKSIVPILLAFAMITSVVFIATPISVFAGGGISNPHGTTINVKAGDNFDLLYKLYWNDVGTDGMFGVTLVWYNYNNSPDENLTFVSAEAYWEDNLAAITCDTPTLSATPSGSDTMYTLEFKNTSYPNPSDENFFVKIKMGAYGTGGIWHKADDNHPIEAPAGLKAVTVFEAAIKDIDGTEIPITVDVRGAGNTVSIAPASKSGWTGENLSYTVTVNNLGELADTYTLTVSDDLGWTQKGFNISTLNVPALGSGNRTLWVIVESGTDTLTVKAAGAYSENTGNCQAIQKTGPQVDVTVTPAWQENLPGGNLYYTMNVKNVGTITDNYDVTVTDLGLAGWTLNPVSYNTGNLAPLASDTRTLTVGISGAAVPSTTNNIKVTAVSANNINVKDNENVQAHVKAAYGVDVKPITPVWQEDWPGRSLCYNVTIQNTGMITDNFDLVVSDTKGWSPTWATVDNYTAWDNAKAYCLTTDDGGTSENFPNTNYGLIYNMYNGWSPTYLSQRDYLKFNLSTLPAATICKAVLWAKSRYGPSAGVLFTDTWHLVNAMTVESDAWTESTLTWNTAPPMGTVLDTENFAADGFVGENKWYAWDVTSWVQNQYEEVYGDKLVTIGLKRADEGAYESVGWFYTRNSYASQAAFRPHLELTYILLTTPSITVTIGAGENLSLCFGVTIPASATPCENDVITVIATSKSDNTAKDNSVCTAHAKLLAIVDVEVTPENQTAHASVVDYLVNPQVSFDPLTYKVAVTNLGLLDDKYELTVTDIRGWSLKVDPSELFVPAGDTEYASLSVTVPEDTWAGTTDTITVTATGKLASMNQVVLGPSDKDSVLAIAGLVHGIQIEVLPDEIEPQTGAPGSPLVWLVVIKNTGNSPNDFVLDVDEVLEGKSSASDPLRIDWGATLRQNAFTLDPCEKATTYLDVTVPEDAKTCEWTNITVTVTKVENQAVTDSVTVRAHALEPGPRIPEGVVEIAVEAEVIAIDVWPTQYDFGVMDEEKTRSTPADYFTVRNTGNVDEKISARGTDAQSMPGEPVTTWKLAGVIGIDQYVLILSGMPLSYAEQNICSSFAPGDEFSFDLTIKTPSVITTPARMWARVKLTAVAA